LGDGVSFADDGDNALLLNDGWFLKTEGWVGYEVP